MSLVYTQILLNQQLGEVVQLRRDGYWWVLIWVTPSGCQWLRCQNESDARARSAGEALKGSYRMLT